MVRKMSAQIARDNFGELISSVHFTKEPVVIEKKGKPYAALVDTEQFEAFLKFRSDQAWEAIERVRALNQDVDPDGAYSIITSEVEEDRREQREARKRSG
jgi:prevent-host-death family protein